MGRFCVWEALRLATIEDEVPEGVPEGTTTSSLSVNKLAVYRRRSSGEATSPRAQAL